VHRLFLGLNLWGGAFLVAAAVSGWVGWSHHVRLGILATVLACLIQSGVVALFLGAAKLIKEHVGHFGMPLSLIDRLNASYHRLVPMAAISVMATATAAIVGGLADVGRAPGWLHHLLSVGATIFYIAIIPLQYRHHRSIHGIVTDVERLLPAAAEEAKAHPGYKPDQVILDRIGRARAFLYIGLSVPMPYLGYTFIVGSDVSYLLLPTVVLTIALLGMSFRLYRLARREQDGRR